MEQPKIFTWGELQEFFREQEAQALARMARADTSAGWRRLQGVVSVWAGLAQNLPTLIALRRQQPPQA